MSTTTLRATPFKQLPKTFDGLCRRHPLRPVHGYLEWEEATQMIHALAGFPLNKDQEDYLESLATLVEEYEHAHDAKDLAHITTLDVLRDLVERNGMTASDLGELLGNRSLGSKILRGERALSKAHIVVLCGRFKVSADLFLRG